ncbi:hypothetical protein HA466_0135720 [Hirschfeldia incana]|nr:hypothetical protein HA466_0135720 [Hirschfeldia incana]
MSTMKFCRECNKTESNRYSSTPAVIATTRKQRMTTVFTETRFTILLVNKLRSSLTLPLTPLFPAPRPSAAPSVNTAKLSSSRLLLEVKKE